MKGALPLLVAVAVLWGCGGADEGGAPFEVPGPVEETTEVTLPASYRFEPAAIAIEAGDTVTWSNEDNFPHNVHLLDGSETTLDLSIGERASHAFDEVGTVYYECSLHPQQMRGKVVVR